MKNNNVATMIKSLDLYIPDDIGIYQDKSTKARSIAIPFDYPDGEHGAVIMTRISPSPWRPSKIIEKITITFYDN